MFQLRRLIHLRKVRFQARIESNQSTQCFRETIMIKLFLKHHLHNHAQADLSISQNGSKRNVSISLTKQFMVLRNPI